MSERKYSVAEIDGLRRAVENKYLWGSFTMSWTEGAGSMSRCYKEEEKAKVVEEQVRTYMLAGVTADDLYASERPTPTPAQKAFPHPVEEGNSGG